MEETIYLCPKCNAPLVLRNVLKSKFFEFTTFSKTVIGYSDISRKFKKQEPSAIKEYIWFCTGCNFAYDFKKIHTDSRNTTCLFNVCNKS